MRVAKIIEAGTWRSALRELLLIVAGVLIALWVNNLHENREERRREYVALRQLLAATRENEVRVRQASYEEGVVAEGAERVLSAMDHALPADSIERMVGRIMWVSDYHPVTGIYSAVAQSGDLALIRNERLRGAVPAFAGEVEGIIPALAITAQEDLHEFMELSAIRANHATAASAARIRAVVAGVGMNAALRVQQMDLVRKGAAELRQQLESELKEPAWTPPPLRLLRH